MKVTVKGVEPAKNTITMKTRPDKKPEKASFMWWKAKSKEARGEQLIATAAFLKQNQNFRYKQAALFARLYGNVTLANIIGGTSKMDLSQSLPIDRPTFNIVQSCVDTLVSKISQSRPQPVFLTDNGDYRERNLAKKLNNFIQGEFYSCKAYALAEYMLRDALVEGTGCLHVFETSDNRVGLERVLLTELLTDPNESIYGDPRQLFRLKLMDRAVLREMIKANDEASSGAGSAIDDAEAAFPDNSAEASKSASDLVMVVEGWHLKSGKDATDGRHIISCTAGVLLDEEWDADRFPFVFLHFSARMAGFWAQGLAEQLMGTQLEINSLLWTISKAIKLVGVPRIFVEDGSKVSGASFNNDIGTIVKYRGTKPEYEVAPCVPQELYAQLQRLIQYGYQQSGVSALGASGEKPAGLDSGEAIRTYDDINNDRFAALSKRYDNVFVDLAYLIMDFASSIAEREGSYSTVYPNKDGTKEIDLPEAAMNAKNPFVIQCFNMSSLPRDPAGRMQKVTEMIQSGMVTIKEGRRLLDFPDLGQSEKLANASEERIFQTLDNIVNEGDFNPPDPFMDLPVAKELVVQYYNLYASANLEEDRQQMLRDWYTQILALGMAAQPTAGLPPGADPSQGGAAPQPGANPPQAQPMPLPQSQLVPNAVGAQ